MGCGLSSSVESLNERSIQEDIYNFASQGDVFNLGLITINVGDQQSSEWYLGIYQQDQAIHRAAAKNYVDCMILLLDRGASIHAKNTYGNTPLHRACAQGNYEATKLLIERGADLNSKNNDGDSPLHYCVKSGREECIKLLLQSGANIEIKNNNDFSPEQFSIFDSPKSIRGSFFKSKIKTLFEEEKVRRVDQCTLDRSLSVVDTDIVDTTRQTSDESIFSRSLSYHS